MITWVRAKKTLEKQWDIEFYWVELDFELSELGLSSRWVLTIEDWKRLENVREYVLRESEDRITNNQMLSKLTPHALTSIVLDIFYSAMDSCSKDWKNVFTLIIKESKDKLRQRMNKKYDIDDKKVSYEITNKQLLDFIKRENWIVVNDSETEWDDNKIELLKKQIDELKNIILTSDKEKVTELKQVEQTKPARVETNKIKKMKIGNLELTAHVEW